MIIYKTDQPISQKKTFGPDETRDESVSFSSENCCSKIQSNKHIFLRFGRYQNFKFVSREGEEWIMGFLEMKGLTSLHLDRSNHFYPFRIVSDLHQLP